ncbi:MAG: hypothetical protein AAB414_02325 [Patescibacteria group bacterium]|mgnify:CR=1 FL=1
MSRKMIGYLLILGFVIAGLLIVTGHLGALSKIMIFVFILIISYWTLYFLEIKR